MLNHQIRNITEIAHLAKMVDTPFCITESLFFPLTTYVNKVLERLF